MNLKKLSLALALGCASFVCFGQKSQLKNFPENCNPETVGKAVAYHFIETPHRLSGRAWMDYPENCTTNGAIMFSKVTNDKQLLDLLVKRFEPLFGDWKNTLPGKGHVDHNMFGGTPLNLYLMTKDERYLKMGLEYADTQWSCPETATAEEKAWAEKGYTWQTRMWIDDMYMITIVQSRAYLATGDSKYLDRAANEMCMYLDELQNDNGLFYHAPDVPYYWCRGDGWMATGLTEMLKIMPKNHPNRKRIMEGYKLMMENLLKYQNAEGLWNQLIDQPDFWTETSGSAMFTYAFITGVKQGWLDAKVYGPAARKAWIALVSYINENNDIRNVCIGTNKKDDKQYYYDRKRNIGDFHGQAPVLWCATALLEE